MKRKRANPHVYFGLKLYGRWRWQLWKAPRVWGGKIRGVSLAKLWRGPELLLLTRKPLA